jgi:hypothetical protein
MSANTAAIFPLTPKVSWGTVITANTAMDGTGTVVTLYTAGSNGSRLDTIKVRNQGTSVATVLRLFINNGAATTTATNNSLYYESTIPAATLTQTAAIPDIEIPMDLALPSGYKITATIGTTTAFALSITAVGGDY